MWVNHIWGSIDITNHQLLQVLNKQMVNTWVVLWMRITWTRWWVGIWRFNQYLHHLRLKLPLLSIVVLQAFLLIIETSRYSFNPSVTVVITFDITSSTTSSFNQITFSHTSLTLLSQHACRESVGLRCPPKFSPQMHQCNDEAEVKQLVKKHWEKIIRALNFWQRPVLFDSAVCTLFGFTIKMGKNEAAQWFEIIAQFDKDTESKRSSFGSTGPSTIAE